MTDANRDCGDPAKSEEAPDEEADISFPSLFSRIGTSSGQKRPAAAEAAGAAVVELKEVDPYPTGRGLVAVFHFTKDRKGNHADVDAISRTFEQGFGFKVLNFPDYHAPKLAEAHSKVKECLRKEEFASLTVFLLGHGTEDPDGAAGGAATLVQTADDLWVDVKKHFVNVYRNSKVPERFRKKPVIHFDHPGLPRP